MRRSAYVVAVAGIVLVTGTAVAQQRRPASPLQEVPGAVPKYEPLFPTGSTWTLREINGKGPAGEAPSLLMDANFRGTGFSGCNTFSATLFPVRGQRLAMGPIALTKKKCDAVATGVERLYLGILHSGPTWSINGSQLTVKGPPGVLVFQRGL